VTGIYAIRHNISGRLYIGSAVNIERRIASHVLHLRKGNHKNQYLQNAWNKYGESDFVEYPLLMCSAPELLFFEQRAFDVFCKRKGSDSLFNTCLTAGSRLGTTMSDLNRAKLAERMRGNAYTLGRKLSAEHRAKISTANKGNKRGAGHSPSKETRTKIGAASKGNRYAVGSFRSPESNAARRAKLIGRVLPEERKEKIRSKLLGHVVSPETRRKLSFALTGRTDIGQHLRSFNRTRRGQPLSSEHRAKIGASNRGRTRSSEARQNMRDGWAERKTRLSAALLKERNI